jgi:heat shock protein HtpX
MNIAKRIFLFLLTNILVLTTISIITSVLGVQGYLTTYGIDYRALATLCLIWGMSGSLISLLLSRWLAKVAMQVKLVDPNAGIMGEERHLLETVYRLANRAGLDTMPQVGIYFSNEVNAFATGPSQHRALVAVSSGLLQKMNADEVEGVLAHEVSHIANGDMVTMTLLQGVVNAFSMFLSRVVVYALSMAWERNQKDRHSYLRSTAIYYVLAIVFDLIITLLGSMLVAAFSRHREYRADKGGAELAGRHKMLAALERLQFVIIGGGNKAQPGFIEPLKIARRRGRYLSLLASHPDISLRIAALKK